jgi:hypothetical protein
MGRFRTVLAYLIAFAVALAPVAATMLGSAGARAATAAAAAKHDCRSSGQNRDQGSHNHSGKADCPDCQDQDQDRDYAKCTGDGIKCCKLTGMVTVLPDVASPALSVSIASNLPALIGWRMGPSPPPPRA